MHHPQARISPEIREIRCPRNQRSKTRNQVVTSPASDPTFATVNTF